MHFAYSSRLDELAGGLPFAVNDFGAAADAFVRWQATEAQADLETVELWAYCYTIWYLYAKFSRERTSGVSDLDAALDDAYDRILRSFGTIHDPERFPHYVSVICRNVLLSHRGRRKDTVEIEDQMVSVAENGAETYDRALARRVWDRAFEALPPAIRDIGRMRLLDERSYQDIAHVTGRPIASVRAYVSKAKARLRADPAILALYGGFSASGDPRTD